MCVLLHVRNTRVFCVPYIYMKIKNDKKKNFTICIVLSGDPHSYL